MSSNHRSIVTPTYRVTGVHRRECAGRRKMTLRHIGFVA
jgi:hypothetical protein